MKPLAEFEFVEDATSDLSFVARGETCEDALGAASEALLAATVEDPASVRDNLERSVDLVEADLDLLLLRLLNELVYLRDADRVRSAHHRPRAGLCPLRLPGGP